MAIKKAKKTKKAKKAKRPVKKAIRRKIIKKNKPSKIRSQKQKTAPKKKPVKRPKPALKQVVLGKITHYFPKVRAAVVVLKSALSAGDKVRIKGHTTDFSQIITSMQIDHTPVNTAKKGDEIGLLVNSRVRDKDIVYKG